MPSPPYKPPAGLRALAVVTAAATLILISIGGIVTSRGSGLAVPDWPTTYGYNMFFFPFSKWVGGIVEEHSHRLVGTLVGFLSILLTAWLHGRHARRALRGLAVLLLLAAAGGVFYSRGHSQDSIVLFLAGAGFLGASFFWPASDPSPRWMRRLGWIALVSVVIQGVLGGLRVTLLSDVLGVVHGTFAQLFFCLLCALALFLSRFWEQRPKVYQQPDAGGLRRLVLATTLLVLGQLILGATMRHQRAGLAIPDFPLAYGSWWPATDAASVAAYNQHRLESVATLPIQGVHIHLQMTHRLTAVLLLSLISVFFWRAQRHLGWASQITRFAAAWLSLAVTQVLLGAATVWTGKSADIATAHVAVGALTLATGVLLVILTRAVLAPRNRSPVSQTGTGRPLPGALALGKQGNRRPA